LATPTAAIPRARLVDQMVGRQTKGRHAQVVAAVDQGSAPSACSADGAHRTGTLHPLPLP